MQDALKQHQIALETLYNKNQTLKRVRAEFTECDTFDFAEFMSQHEIDEEFGFSLLTQMALHRRADLPTLVGVLRSHFNDGQKTVDMILKCAEVDLVDWDPTISKFITVFTISEDVQADLDRFQYPLPMVIEPKEVKNNKSSGYLTSSGSIILKNNHHEEDVCLDHINRMNKIKFTINTDTATMVANKWRNLDKPKAGESQQDYERRVRAFEKYDRTCKDVIDVLTEHGNEFYLTHKYDKRGRIYCQGYHISYQGAPWNKAVLELADKEIVEL